MRLLTGYIQAVVVGFQVCEYRRKGASISGPVAAFDGFLDSIGIFVNGGFIPIIVRSNTLQFGDSRRPLTLLSIPILSGNLLNICHIHDHIGPVAWIKATRLWRACTDDHPVPTARSRQL